jgi:hypothetical protein
MNASVFLFAPQLYLVSAQVSTNAATRAELTNALDSWSTEYHEFSASTETEYSVSAMPPNAEHLIVAFT